MPTLSEILQDAKNCVRQLDKGNDLQNIGEFDPTEYGKTQPIRDASTRFVERIMAYDNEQYATAFEKIPPFSQTQVKAAVQELRACITETINNIQKQKGIESPRRVQAEWFPGTAHKIEAAEDQIYKVLEPIRIPEAQTIRAEELRAELDAKLQRMQETIAEAKSTTQDALVAVAGNKEVVSLAQAIADHSDSAKKWLWAFITCCGVTLLIMVAFLWTTGNANALDSQLAVASNYIAPESPMDSGTVSRVLITNSIAFFAAKVILISFALGLCVITARIYQTHAHNAIVCRQRLLATDLFKDLYRSIESSDQAGKIELIKQASQAVLAHTSTGFLHKGGNEMMPWVEIAKEAVKRGS